MRVCWCLRCCVCGHLLSSLELRAAKGTLSDALDTLSDATTPSVCVTTPSVCVAFGTLTPFRFTPFDSSSRTSLACAAADLRGEEEEEEEEEEEKEEEEEEKEAVPVTVTEVRRAGKVLLLPLAAPAVATVRQGTASAAAVSTSFGHCLLLPSGLQCTV